MTKIKNLFSPNDVYFSSDHHFGHLNIIKYCNRPFKDNEEQTNYLIESWNNKISKNDIVFYLGDFALSSNGYCKKILNALNGKKYLVVGNHEKTIINCDYLRKEFEGIYDILEIKINDEYSNDKFQNIILSHFPFLKFGSYKGIWHFFAHVHGNLIHPDENATDVGVDTNDKYEPYNYYELKKKLNK